MTGKELSCLRCGGSMEEGYTLDQGMGAFPRTAWIRRRPRRRFLRPPFREWNWITTYRCTQCGYLESYAKTR
jgi:hypothetical protein